MNLAFLEKISLPDQVLFEQLVRLATEMPKLKQICWENQLSEEENEVWNEICYTQSVEGPNVTLKGSLISFESQESFQFGSILQKVCKITSLNLKF